VVPTLADALAIPWDSDGRTLYDEAPRILYTETGLSEAAYFPAGHRGYPFDASAKSYDIDPATTRVFARPDVQPDVVRVKDRFVHDGVYKLVWYAMSTGFHLGLFDTRADPRNHHDLLGERPEIAESLWPTLRDRLRADGEEVPESAASAQALPPPER
jgi:hypothetical protein